MNRHKVLLAIEAAEAFIEQARRTLERDDLLIRDGWTGVFYTGTKETGQLRRDSLDLTRILAEMRRPS